MKLNDNLKGQFLFRVSQCDISHKIRAADICCDCTAFCCYLTRLVTMEIFCFVKENVQNKILVLIFEFLMHCHECVIWWPNLLWPMCAQHRLLDGI